MYYQDVVSEAQELLRDAGFPVPRVRKVGVTREWLSSCYPGRRVIEFGKLARYADELGVRPLVGSAVHELGHILVHFNPPNRRVREIFTPKDGVWEGEYQYVNLFKFPKVSWYGNLDGEEALCEALRLLVTGGVLADKYRQGLELWRRRIA